MESGKIVLASLPQSDGKTKLRPALVLKVIQPYNDLLVCGISTQLHQEVKDFDSVVFSSEPDFKQTELTQSSLIRLGYLAVLSKKIVAGSIGKISDKRLLTIKQTLADFILEK